MYDEADFRLLLAFDSDDPEFTRGFEAGCVWESLASSAGSMETVVHTSNAEMMLRIAEAAGRQLVAGDGYPQLGPDIRQAVEAEWMDVSFGPRTGRAPSGRVGPEG